MVLQLNSFEKYEVRLHGKVLKVFLGLMTYEFEDFKGKILRVPTSKDLSGAYTCLVFLTVFGSKRSCLKLRKISKPLSSEIFQERVDII